MDYTRVMTALRRRRWYILAAVIGCTGATGYGALRMPREYQASATLLLQEQATRDFSDMTALPEVPTEKDDLEGRRDRVKTIATVLTSPEIVSRVIEKVGLKGTPAQVQENLVVEEVTSQTLRVGLKDRDPKVATLAVNTMVDEFLPYFARLRNQELSRQLEALSAEKQEAERELDQSGDALEGFKRANNISDIQTQIQESWRQASEVERSRTAAEAELRDVDRQLARVQEQYRQTPAMVRVEQRQTQATLLDTLRSEVARLRTQLAQELTRRTEEHPEVRRVKQQLEDAENRLSAESGKLQTIVEEKPNPVKATLLADLQSLQKQRDGLTARVRDLNSKLGAVQERASQYSGKDVQLSRLTQRHEFARQRLERVAGRLTGVENALAGLQETPIAVVDRSGERNPPVDLSQGRAMKLTLLAFVMSLAVCVALAVGLEMSDRRVRSVADVESLTQLPVVSVVPSLPSGRGSQAALCRTTENDPSGHMAESFHFLANHVLRQTLRRENTVLMGATARPGQGATTALSNLAIALARAGRRVVLVEADLRRPELHRIFECDERPGLTDVLQGFVPVEEALAPTSTGNLYVLAAGSAVQDPWSLLWQPAMGAAVQALRECSDYVIFNVPSATVFADALCVAPHVDGAVLVMRTSELPNGAEQKVREWLDDVGVPVMGVVLNGVPQKEMDSYDFHRSYTARRVDEHPALAAPVSVPARRAA
ncbi:MAG: GumC family protein [Armatimonadota bacterium]